MHVILGGSRALSPDAIRGLYDGWTVEEEPLRRKRSATDHRRPEGLLLAKPTCPPDAAAPPLAASN